MTIFDSFKETILQKPVHLKKPDFYKADSDAKIQLDRLQELYATASDQEKPQIERDIKLLSYGIAGEESIAFELNNSYLPLIVLHDLRLEYEGLSAQIDYLIITPKLCLVVECKNLFGNIEVNNKGEFIRDLTFNGRRKKEGIYSPITQNIRHMEMIKRIGAANKTNFLLRTAFEKLFDENYRSVIVLANPKTVINTKYAPKEIKDQIIRSDQLIAYIKKLNKESKNLAQSEKDMYKQADFLMSLHTVNPTDYTEKYFQQKPIEKPLYEQLKQYRYATSKAEGIKAFQIFTNAQLEALVATMPVNHENLHQMPGFGTVKCEKYGEEIVRIIRRYQEEHKITK